MLSGLHRRRLNWHFRVYVKRLYEHRYPGKNGFTLEMVLVDSDGVRVHASIPTALVNRWLGNIKEFHMYDMKNFIVVERRHYIRTTNTQYALNFSHMTVVEAIEESSFPLDVFNFKPFTALLHAEHVDETEMFDIIGEVVGKEEPRDVLTSKGVTVKRMAVVLEDIGGNRLSCVVFGGLVDQLLPVISQESVEPVIVVLQYFRPSRWNEKTSIQSNFDVSGLHINPDLKVVDEFRTIILTGAGSNGVRITPLDSQSAVSGAQELKSGNIDISTAEEVYNAQEVADRWIFGKIVAVNSGKTNWCYKACIKCPKKFETKTGDLYSCKKCNITFDQPKDRYKVEVVAFDGTACITLLLWDRECKSLCGMEATELLKLVDENLEEHPSQLDNLLEKKLLFKLNVKSSNIDGGDLVYPVMKICDDDDMVKKYQPIEFDTNPCVGSPDVKASNTGDVSGPVVSLGSDHDTQLNVGAGEASVTSIKTKTVSKRNRTSRKPCIKGKDGKDKGQTSTNRFCKKGEKKNVKRVRVIFDDTSD